MPFVMIVRQSYNASIISLLMLLFTTVKFASRSVKQMFFYEDNFKNPSLPYLWRQIVVDCRNGTHNIITERCCRHFCSVHHSSDDDDGSDEAVLFAEGAHQ